ncbi:MAG TPA: DnaA/Hda family protein [Paracoccaceae bacterium]|nr:DnaA/Hda family protein [Paracoccaceae bacterium]
MTRPRQGAFDLRYRPHLAAEEFFVSECNRNAWTAIRNWQRWPSRRLALTGPAESGKTHLGAIWAKETGAAWLHAAEMTEARMHRLMEVPAVLVENVDRVAGLPEPVRRQIETALFHLLNFTAAEGRLLLITGRAGPGRWDLLTPDLASRVSALPHVAIAPPDDAILSLVLQKLFRDRQQVVGQDVIDYVVLRSERSFAAARELAAALDRKALAERRRITRPLAAELLAERAARAGAAQEGDWQEEARQEEARPEEDRDD